MKKWQDGVYEIIIPIWVIFSDFLVVMWFIISISFFKETFADTFNHGTCINVFDRNRTLA